MQIIRPLSKKQASVRYNFKKFERSTSQKFEEEVMMSESKFSNLAASLKFQISIFNFALDEKTGALLVIVVYNIVYCDQRNSISWII